MSWGVPRRPKISTKLGNPNPREGSDGDIQIKGSRLGAKLFAKWSGRWWDVPLSRDGVTKFGVTDSNYLSIDRDSVDIFTNKVKVASFGATTTVKDINLTGKIVITSTGTQNVCLGAWSTGNPDVPGSLNNIAIGVDAGNKLESGATYNTLIGTQAGKLIEQGDDNICIGGGAGNSIVDSDGHVFIGIAADLSGSADDAIGIGQACSAAGGGIVIGTLISAAGGEFKIGNVSHNVSVDFSSIGTGYFCVSDAGTGSVTVDSFSHSYIEMDVNGTVYKVLTGGTV